MVGGVFSQLLQQQQPPSDLSSQRLVTIGTCFLLTGLWIGRGGSAPGRCALCVCPLGHRLESRSHVAALLVAQDQTPEAQPNHLNCLKQGVRVTPAHIPLAKSNHMARPQTSGMGMYITLILTTKS